MPYVYIVLIFFWFLVHQYYSAQILKSKKNEYRLKCGGVGVGGLGWGLHVCRIIQGKTKSNWVCYFVFCSVISEGSLFQFIL